MPFRGEEKSYTHLKTSGELGQLIPIRWSIRDRASIKEAMRFSNVVVNLVGRWWDTRNFTMEQVHVDGARAIAECARECGVERLVHVSALAANTSSESDWVRTKLEGEKAVRLAFPNATILRPGPLWGAEDSFLMPRAGMVRYWPVMLVQNPQRRIAPVFVNDVATAILASLRSNDAVGKTYELAGPQVTTEEEVANFVMKMLKIHKRTVTLDDESLWNTAYWLGKHRNPRMTTDSIKFTEDTVASGKYPDFSALGITQEYLQPLYSQLALTYVQHLRKPARQVEVNLDDEPEEVKQLQRAQPNRPIY